VLGGKIIAFRKFLKKIKGVNDDILKQNGGKNKIKMDSDDVHVHPIQFQLYQLYDNEFF
jgi:hypothetical protein